MNKDQRVKCANETLDILKQGLYIKNGKRNPIKNDLDFAVKNSVLYAPHMFNDVEAKMQAELENAPKQKTKIEVTEETTLQASKRLLGQYQNVTCLNFASAKNPGGGFLRGTMAQEESLAYASGLYACINPMKEMYDFNRKRSTSLYSDYMAFSPNVPVFRDDNGNLLEEYYRVSMLTSAAVNAGAVRDNESKDVIAKIKPTMIARIEKILSLLVAHQQEAIVLGAFGCGVFKNNPFEVAKMFNEFLKNDDRFNSYFKHVAFAIYDNSPSKDCLRSFRRIYG